MEGDLTDESAAAKKPRSIAESFDEAFPQYLAMGMTYTQFWEEDCALVIPYRKAYKLRLDHENYNAWLQGLYIYEALGCVSPLLHAFAQRGTRAEPYPDKPYEFTSAKKQSEQKNNETKMQNAVNFMEKLTAQFNKQFREKQAAKGETQ